MKTLQIHKSFNIVGFSTGCSLAMEMARQLESQGIHVSLLLIENPSHLIQLGIKSTEELQNDLLTVLGKLCPKQVCLFIIDNDPS